MPGRVGQDRFRHRIANEDLNVSGSARRPLRAHAKTGKLAKVRHRTQVSMTVAAGRNCQQRLSPRRLLQVGLRRKREAPREKEAKRLMVSPAAPREVARLAQWNAARHRGSRKAARENRKKEHLRRGHNSSDAIVVATPDRKFRGRLFCSGSRAGCTEDRHAGDTPAATVAKAAPRSARRSMRRL
jgi:hypothetical protein